MAYKWSSKDVTLNYQGKCVFKAGDPIPAEITKNMDPDTLKEYVANGNITEDKKTKTVKTDTKKSDKA